MMQVLAEKRRYIFVGENKVYYNEFEALGFCYENN